MAKLNDIISLANKPDPDLQLVALFKYICLFLNENIDSIEDANIINHFVNNVFPKYKLDSISKFIY